MIQDQRSPSMIGENAHGDWNERKWVKICVPYQVSADKSNRRIIKNGRMTSSGISIKRMS
jgi:hypothetical protein